MGWKIETLVLNRLTLKEEHDLESDDYNNLLIIEKKAKELYELKILSTIEVKILNCFSNGLTLTDISKEVPLSKETIILIFRKACEKLSFCLGGEFTDFGTIDELIDKYDLSEEQIDNLITYMNSEYKHKLSRIKK
jgi:hypothetical protein